MAMDAEKFAKAALSLCPELEGDKLCAIADFTYNLGVGRLKHSTLRKRINAGDWGGAAIELRKWVNGGGKRLPGLVLRREAEINLLIG
jgi:lysozyme